MGNRKLPLTLVQGGLFSQAGVAVNGGRSVRPMSVGARRMSGSAGQNNEDAAREPSGARSIGRLPGRDGRPLRRGRGEGRGSFGRGSVGRLVVLFMFAGLGAFVLCAVGLALAQRHAALVETVRDAEVTTTLLATRVVQPAFPPSPSSGRLDADEHDRGHP